MYGLKNGNKMGPQVPNTQLKKQNILETFEGPCVSLRFIPHPHDQLPATQGPLHLENTDFHINMMKKMI